MWNVVHQDEVRGRNGFYLVVGFLALCLIVGFTSSGLHAPGLLRGIGIGLTVLTLMDALPFSETRGVGLLFARGGAVATLILGELEIGQGPHFYPQGDDWLIIGVGFALQALFLQLFERSRAEAEDRNRSEQADLDRSVAEQRHGELQAALSEILRTRTDPPVAPAAPRRVLRSREALACTGLGAIAALVSVTWFRRQS